MDNDKKDSFVIDVAKDKTYQNQYDDYHKLFSEWRGDEKNPYGYKFVHDTREHTYMDGEGFIQKKADIAERMSLLKCSSLLGIVLLIMITLDGLRYLWLEKTFHDPTADIIYFSEKATKVDIFGLFTTLMDCSFVLLKFLLGIGIFTLITKIPYRVIAPKSNKKSKFLVSGVVIMLMLMVMGRICGYFMSEIFGIVGIDVVYSNMIFSRNIWVSLIYIFLNCIMVSALQEFFFRGVVLQTFRQFGDVFAIIVSSVACALCYYDLSTIGYALISSIALGLFTIKTGTLKTAVVMSVSANCINYFLSALSIGHVENGQIIETVVCTVIIGAAVLIFSRLISNGKWTFNIKTDDSQISTSNKLKICATTMTVALWIVAAIVLVTISFRSVL